MKVRVFSLFIGLFFIVVSAASQDECGMSDNKKAVKAYEKATDKKKYGYGERLTFFNEALSIDPDFTRARWDKTFIRIKKARGSQKPYQAALNDLLQVAANCPNVHSALYFFIAEIYMNSGDYANAAEYYTQFMAFESDDDKKFERRYDEQLLTASETAPRAKFLAEQYANPHPFNAKKLVPLSSAESDEYLPAISPDNEVLLFTRKSEVQTTGRETSIKSDFTPFIERFSIAHYSGNGFDQGEALEQPFNKMTDANYGGACLTTDNKTIYFTQCEPYQGKMNCDIFVSHYKQLQSDDGNTYWGWTEPENLGPNINTDDGWESQPTVSKDGKWLMYSVIKKGTRGIDIYQSSLMPNGQWGPGESLGEPINTAGHEKSPFFHSDNKTLYFASKNGHMGLGGYDVFMSKFKDGEWSTPQNLGYPLNTPDDEHGYIVSLDGKTAYFSSQFPYNGAKSKTLDMYQVILPPPVRPNKVLMVKGQVKTVKGLTPKNAKIELRNTKTQEVETVEINQSTGAFVAIVDVEDSADYVLTAKGEDLAFNTKLIKAPKENEPIKAQVNVITQKSKTGQHITIENIHFSTNSADLTQDSKASLDALVQYMKEYPNYKISVEGHTDNVGDDKTNMALSADRAFSVMAYLQEQGVVANRLKFKGWGETKPKASNSTASGRAKNRRIEIVVLAN